MLGSTKGPCDFKEAEGLFRQTGDKRGLIYCLISNSQLAFKNDRDNALKTLKEALKKAKAYGYEIEEGYAKMVLSAFYKNPDMIPFNLA